MHSSRLFGLADLHPGIAQSRLCHLGFLDGIQVFPFRRGLAFIDLLLLLVDRPRVFFLGDQSGVLGLGGREVRFHLGDLLMAATRFASQEGYAVRKKGRRSISNKSSPFLTAWFSWT